MAELWIEAGADINAYSGYTPLMSSTPWPQIVRMLLEAGADPMLKDGHGQTMIDHAIDAPWYLSGPDELESLKIVLSACPDFPREDLKRSP